MTLVSKGLLGGTSLAGGGCCAVTVPVVMSTSSVRDSKLEQVSAEGISDQEDSPALVKCSVIDKDGLEEVSFGDRENKNICGFTSTVNNSVIKSEIEGKYTNLFKEMGNNKTSSGNDSKSKLGKNQCNKDSKTGYLSPSEGDEYLGVCDNTSLAEKSGITIENKNKAKMKIKVCQGECWNRSSNSSDVEVLSVQKGDGKEVKFRKTGS